MKQEGLYIGIDVANAHLGRQVQVSGEPWRVTNYDPGISAVVAHLGELAPTLVVVEPTGGLELPLTAALAASGLPVAVINPHQVRDFAKAPVGLPRPIGWMPKCWPIQYNPVIKAFYQRRLAAGK